MSTNKKDNIVRKHKLLPFLIPSVIIFLILFFVLLSARKIRNTKDCSLTMDKKIQSQEENFPVSEKVKVKEGKFPWNDFGPSSAWEVYGRENPINVCNGKICWESEDEVFSFLRLNKF